ncbi:abnormal chemosensory jump [Trichuris trichiura]|uniref:POU domain protein n=1 Tax=Trichuris trichiura TaxID=36087 RepID=A0A077Z4K0_TRITR|nr:abnormal chemosensory jump [Trichuris trichiura]
MQTQRFYSPFPTGTIPMGRYSPSQYARSAAEQMRRQCIGNGAMPPNFFSGIDESLFSVRAEAAFVASIDRAAVGAQNSMLKTDMMPTYTHLTTGGQHPQVGMTSPMDFHLENAPMSSMSSMIDPHQMAMAASMGHHQLVQYPHGPIGNMGPAALPTHHHPSFAPGNVMPAVSRPLVSEPETDPRELESFADHFKQRRIKLGVTQADVGKALANLKLPGVGSLSQSTICRFESLTLSHNNMIALRPILSAWLEQAEAAARGKIKESNGILPGSEKKRKRTSIAATEKRSLEAYFTMHPRPSGEKIAAIAEKLELKKNVVRVWFCNQRQKQKRYSYVNAWLYTPVSAFETA